MLSSAQGGKIQHSPNRVIRAAAYEKKPNRRCKTVQQNRGITERNEPVGLRCPIPASIPPTPSLRIRNEPNSPMQHMQHALPMPAGHPISTQPLCFPGDPSPLASQIQAPNATQCNINPPNRARVARRPAPQNRLNRSPRQRTGKTTSHQPPATAGRPQCVRIG
jgi:hypothetical protein